MRRREFLALLGFGLPASGLSLPQTPMSYGKIVYMNVPELNGECGAFLKALELLAKKNISIPKYVWTEDT